MPDQSEAPIVRRLRFATADDWKLRVENPLALHCDIREAAEIIRLCEEALGRLADAVTDQDPDEIEAAVEQADALRAQIKGQNP